MLNITPEDPQSQTVFTSQVNSASGPQASLDHAVNLAQPRNRPSFFSPQGQEDDLHLNLPLLTDAVDYRHLLGPFSSFIDPENLEAIQCAEQVEATILRQLRLASADLCTREGLPFDEEELPMFLNSPHLHALFPLALGRSPSPVQQNLDGAQLQSLDNVLHLWKQYMGIK